jgi:chloride channel protein, CIC family
VVAVLRGEMTRAPARVIPVKFAGGLLAIGGGLALGREGPTVQMGATLGTIVAAQIRPIREAWPALLAAGAGAGLATAFNAPLGGMLFVFEEVLRRFEPRAVMATATACIAAVVVERAVLGLEPDFTVPFLHPPVVAGLGLYLIMGLVAGAFGALYNHAILGLPGIADRFDRLPAAAKGGLVGVLVGGVAWLMPKAVGAGDGLTQEILAGQAAITALPMLFVVRFMLGPVSYRAGRPADSSLRSSSSARRSGSRSDGSATGGSPTWHRRRSPLPSSAWRRSSPRPCVPSSPASCSSQR